MDTVIITGSGKEAHYEGEAKEGAEYPGEQVQHVSVQERHKAYHILLAFAKRYRKDAGGIYPLDREIGPVRTSSV